MSEQNLKKEEGLKKVSMSQRSHPLIIKRLLANFPHSNFVVICRV